MSMAAREPGSITPEGRIVRVAGPQNEEFDFGRLDGTITPTEQFYIRSHGPTLSLDRDSWRLEVGGMVERPLALSLVDLQAMPDVEEVATLECAGNRRTFQNPVPGGVPWQDGAISTARWGGVPLAAILTRSGLQPGARHVLLEGADPCPTDAGPQPFARSIPLELALTPAALLALTMNGAPLPPEHGFPARLVLPRLYAMNDVKWLTRVVVQAEPHTGHFQVSDYRLWFDDEGPGSDMPPVRVAAVIARPRSGDTLPAGRTRIHGAAWTGTGVVERVEVSADDGRTWHAATLQDAAREGVWRLWEWEWQAPPGEHTLRVRATDSTGNTQPESLPPNRKGYANNFILATSVRVE
jgi:DMSO/TMAO reductase YedYZ molybdopterin-dependent catalytic subunit